MPCQAGKPVAADPQLSLSSPHPTRAGAGGSVVLPKPTCTAEEMACKKKKKVKTDCGRLVVEVLSWGWCCAPSSLGTPGSV